jgi:hypothetical protein
MHLCHCFSHSLVFTFACADPTHDIKQYFTEHKPIIHCSAATEQSKSEGVAEKEKSANTAVLITS